MPGIFPPDALTSLFEPESIAVIGASGRKNRPGYDSVACANTLGWKGTVYPVTPKYQDIAGWSCVESISDIGKPIDLVIIAGSPSRMVEDLEQSIAAGAKSVVIYGNPLIDPDPKFNQQIREIIDAAKIPVLGPNSIGYVNYARQSIGSWIPPTVAPTGRIAGIIQSGAIFGACTLTDPRIRYSFAAHPGHEISVTVGAMINYALSLPETGVIAIYLEIIVNPAEFINALKNACDANIPVVVLKPGRSQASRSAVSTHAGRMAADDKIIDAVLRKYHAIRVNNLDEFWTTLCLFSHVSEIGTGGLTVTGDSGGMKAQIIDEAENLELPLTTFSKTTKKKLRDRLVADLPAENPVDFWGGEEHLTEHVSGILEDITADPGTAITVAMGEYGLVKSDVFTDRVAEGVMVAAMSADKPIVAGSYSARQFYSGRTMKFDAAGVAVLDGVPNMMRAIKYAFQFRDRIQSTKSKNEHIQKPNEALTRAVEQARSDQECDALAVLRHCGIHTVESYLVTNEEQLFEAVEKLHWPMVLKTAEGHAHKSDLDGVLLGINNPAELKHHYSELAKRLGPSATIQGTAPKGIEVALGMINDPDYGPLIMTSSGGKFVELAVDRTFVLTPLSETEAQAMIEQLSPTPLLRGFRNAPALDKNALVQALLSFSQLAMHFRNEILSIDINPLIVHSDGVMAVDALIEFKP